MSEEEILFKIKNKLSPKRFEHTMGVVSMAEKIAEVMNVDRNKARISALCHDCAKNYTKDEQYELCKKYKIELDDYAKKEYHIVHGFLGRYIAQKEYEIEDEEVLNAIYYHTIARENMTDLEKVIYLADISEMGRETEVSKEIRDIIFKEKNINKALLKALDSSIQYVIKKGGILHINSILARNYLLKEGKN